LIDDGARTSTRFQRLRVRFQGRGPGGGAYAVAVAHVGRRSGTTSNVSGASVSVTVNDQRSFAVPEFGLISDEVDIG